RSRASTTASRSGPCRRAPAADRRAAAPGAGRAQRRSAKPPGADGASASRASPLNRALRSPLEWWEMKILVVGSGGREHALCWALRRSPFVDELFCAPGNPGIAEVADCLPVSAGDIVEMADLAEKLKMDLTVVGPELPLALGIGDEFAKRDLPIFGPSRLAAQIEASK